MDAKTIVTIFQKKYEKNHSSNFLKTVLYTIKNFTYKNFKKINIKK